VHISLWRWWCQSCSLIQDGFLANFEKRILQFVSRSLCIQSSCSCHCNLRHNRTASVRGANVTGRRRLRATELFDTIYQFRDLIRLLLNDDINVAVCSVDDVESGSSIAESVNFGIRHLSDNK